MSTCTNVFISTCYTSEMEKYLDCDAQLLRGKSWHSTPPLTTHSGCATDKKGGAAGDPANVL